MSVNGDTGESVSTWPPGPGADRERVLRFLCSMADDPAELADWLDLVGLTDMAAASPG